MILYAFWQVMRDDWNQDPAPHRPGPEHNGDAGRYVL